jgi:D-galactarolactone cycloisomerase
MRTPARLSISSVEAIPIRVPLVRPFRGSHYQMTHRSTIVVRITTDDGIVGEAYAGDEDSSLLEIDRIVNDELAP